MSRTREAGSVLLAVTLVLGVVGAVAFLMTREGALEGEVSRRSAEADHARYVAEAGLRHASWLANRSGCTGYDLADTPFGSDSYRASFTPAYGSPVTVTATATLADGGAHTRETTLPIYEPPVTLVLQPGAEGEDTDLYQWKPGWNYGAATYFRAVASYDSQEHGLLRFDLSGVPSAARVISATLALNVSDNSWFDGPVSVHRVTSDWQEGDEAGGNGPGANWTDTGAGPAWSTPGGDLDPTPVDTTLTTGVGWYTWDVTSLVGDWVAGLHPNYGLAVAPGNSTAQQEFVSGDAPDPAKHPKLTIVYDCECGSGAAQTLTFQPDGAAGDDTYLADGTPATPLGGDARIRLSNKTNAKAYGLLRFDLSSIPAGSLLTSALLELNLEGIGSGGTATVDVHRVTTPWVETQATWNQADTGAPWSTPGGDYDATVEATASIDAAFPGPTTWGVTALVADWLGGAPNDGFYLRASAGVNHADFTTSDGATPSQHPKLVVDVTCPCGGCEVPGGGDGGPSTILLVVGDATEPLSSKDAGRKTLMEEWQYTVTVIDDSVTDNDLDTAAAANDVVYVSGTVSGGTLADKLTGSPTPIVNEFPGKLDNFGFCSGSTDTFSADTFTKSDAAHYISEPFGGGAINALTTFLVMPTPSGTLAPDLQVPASFTDFELAVVTLEAGAQRWDTNPAAARRAHLPFAPAETAQLTAQGELVMQRAIEWAGGAGGSPPAPPNTAILPALADTWIKEATDEQHGPDPQLIIGLDAGRKHYRGLLRFDVTPLPADATVTVATLRLNVIETFGPKAVDTGVYKLTASWDENTDTWNSLGGGVYDPTELANLSVPGDAFGWVEWPLPPGLVHEWIDLANHGLILLPTGGNAQKNNRYDVASRQNGDAALHPQLVVEYTLP